MNQAPECEVGVLVTTDDEIQTLNAQYRGLNTPTDVLTFPAIPNPAGHLGDIAISIDTARTQARLRGALLTHEMQFLAIHGGLHLLGFDDETPFDQEQMVTRMNEVARCIGIPEDIGWWSRSHPGSE